MLLIGLPNPIALALIAGLAEIVPYLGAFIGSIPAVLVAFNLGLGPALWTILAFLVVHLIEGYLAGPMIQRRFVRIPPALMLIGIMATGLVFGPAGVIVAAPLTVAIFVAVKLFYVRDTLQEETEMPGEEADTT
jgi:predicted PurR-regulated permease PerM